MKRIKALFLYLILLTASVQSQSSNHDIHHYLTTAVEYINQEKYEEALPFIEKALSLDSDNAQIWRLKGLTYEMLNRKKEAVNSWQHYLSLAKEDSLKQEAKRHLDALNE